MKGKRTPVKAAALLSAKRVPKALLLDVREMIHTAREGVARAVDSGLTMLYWHVGRRVRQDVLEEKRAEYGEQIVSALGIQLQNEFGRGFSEKSLRHMIRFVEAFPDLKIVSSLKKTSSRPTSSFATPICWTSLGSGTPTLRRTWSSCWIWSTVASRSPRIGPRRFPRPTSNVNSMRRSLWPVRGWRP